MGEGEIDSETIEGAEESRARIKGAEKTKGEQERDSEAIEGAEAETIGAEKTKGEGQIVEETIGAEGIGLVIINNYILLYNHC